MYLLYILACLPLLFFYFFEYSYPNYLSMAHSFVYLSSVSLTQKYFRILTTPIHSLAIILEMEDFKNCLLRTLVYSQMVYLFL